MPVIGLLSVFSVFHMGVSPLLSRSSAVAAPSWLQAPR